MRISRRLQGLGAQGGEALELDLQGVVMPDIIEGAVGAQARAIGGASLPIVARYLTDQNVLFKEVDNAEGP